LHNRTQCRDSFELSSSRVPLKEAEGMGTLRGGEIAARQ
jgi:hypothetical protein